MWIRACGLCCGDSLDGKKLLRTLDFRTGQDDRTTWRLDLGLDGLKQKNASFEFSLSLQHSTF